MNGLSLRINPSNRKNKNSIGFSPVVLSKDENKGSKNALFEEFLSSATVESQLVVMKSILNVLKDSSDAEIMQFLALVFLQAESKHPVKCFLTRHITKTEPIQQPFSEVLGSEIKRLISEPSAEFNQYVDVVMRVATCIENFPAGLQAVRAAEIELASYLTNCLQYCVNKLGKTNPSPTEKNEIYNLTHLALRLLLCIVQRVSENNAGTLISMCDAIREHNKYLLFDEDCPMDTKSICGILFLSMKILEDGPDSWISILKPSPEDDRLNCLLQNEAAQLSLYSAIAIVVSVDRLQTKLDNEHFAIMSLVQELIAIGRRNASESTFILGVTRTTLQISKMADKVADPALGLALVDSVLSFVWGHLEHYMDSVRHLTAQALANVVRYCSRLEKSGDTAPLDRLFTALSSLDKTRKSYYVSLTSLASQLGAKRLMQKMPNVIRDVIATLGVQAVQASATTALETLLQKHALESSTQELYSAWVVPIIERVGSDDADSALLNVLENLLAKALVTDGNVIEYILSHIKEWREGSANSSSTDLKRVLVLLRAARRAGASGDWEAVLGYAVLEKAAVDSVEETRILSLSLVVESPKTTEVFSAGDLDFVLYYLRYNINSQSPNFRQLTLSLMKKFIKRIEDSYKTFARSKNTDGSYYLYFLDRFREFCFASLLPGANYSRRYVALQLLAWTGAVNLDGYDRVWKEEHVEKLLVHLEDSYENNKSLALQILDKCPSDLVKGKIYRIPLDIQSILRQASSMKPTDCVSAAYKLNFIKRKLPENILQKNNCLTDSEPVLFALLHTLLSELKTQLGVCEKSVVFAARQAPMYGILHCMGHLIQEVDADAISSDQHWKALISDTIATCVRATASVACVVNNSSPEGHLPMDAGIATDDTGNTGYILQLISLSSDVRLQDGRPVTAQMVLLCAWRSVKEVSLLLGSIASLLSIEGEGRQTGTLSQRQMVLIGEHFTSLLAETKHRGAFEQAYVGFTRLLARLWRCSSAALHGLPRGWLRALTRAVAAPHARSATRRSAGLPYTIQALVTTELQVQGNPKCLHECMTTLLRLARRTSKDEDTDLSGGNYFTKQEDITASKIPETSTDLEIDTNKFESLALNESGIDRVSEIESLSKENLVESRTHSLNILRALFRNSVLEESLAGYVGEGLMVALDGFEGDTWMERNSSTLLFSALMVRVFGVMRGRGVGSPAPRNTMTGRIFFLRYPRLYDFILNKLRAAAASTAAARLHPCLYPALVLLARLHPSALEGAASSLRLAALLPRVAGAAAAPHHATRRLAAAAAQPLVARDQYFKHIESMLTAIADRNIKRNDCHGVLLQITKLLENIGPDIVNPECSLAIIDKIEPTLWVLEQASSKLPCYVIADEYTKVINLILMKVVRSPSQISDKISERIIHHLNKILLTQNIPHVAPGRELCLANVFNLCLVIHNLKLNTEEICKTVFHGLDHKSYEVVLSALNYLLILHNSLIIENCYFQENLSRNTSFKEPVLLQLRSSKEYTPMLCKVYQNSRYQECLQKSLKVLVLENDTQKYIVQIKQGSDAEASDDEIIRTLLNCIQNEHENLTPIYLESLSKFVSKKLEETSLPISTLLEVLRLIYECSSSDNSDNTRNVVASFMEKNYQALMTIVLDGLSDEDKFEFKSLGLAVITTILEDDDEAIRQRASDVISGGRVLPAKAAEVLLERIDEPAMFVLLALLDFRSEVCMTDEISDECRVFDQNERYNIFLEECMWTVACAQKIREKCENENDRVVTFVRAIIDNDVYRNILDKLCNNNLVIFKKMLLKDASAFNNEVVNPKIELFINELHILNVK